MEYANKMETTVINYWNQMEIRDQYFRDKIRCHPNRSFNHFSSAATKVPAIPTAKLCMQRDTVNIKRVNKSIHLPYQIALWQAGHTHNKTNAARIKQCVTFESRAPPTYESHFPGLKLNTVIYGTQLFIVLQL